MPAKRISPHAIALAAIAGLLFFFYADQFLAPPDCAFYWAWPGAIWRSFSFDFAPIYERLEMPVRYVALTATQHISNDWPPGSGFALLPIVWAGPVLAHAWTILLACFAVAYWAKCASLESLSKSWATAALLCGTPLLFYLLFGPFFSHPVSFAVSTMFLVLWDQTRGRRSVPTWLLLGILLGRAAMVRPQNLLLGMVFLAEGFPGRADILPAQLPSPDQNAEPPRRATSAKGILSFFAGLILAVLPYPIILGVLYGNPFRLPKIEEMQWLHPHLRELLFADWHGVLAWTPIYLPALIGLLLLLRRDSRLAAGLLFAFAAQLYLNAANLVWWSGGSFGCRRLSDSAIIVAYGVGALLESARSRGGRNALRALIGVCCAWTLLLMFAERRGLLPLDRYIAFSSQEYRIAIWRTISEPIATLLGPAKLSVANCAFRAAAATLLTLALTVIFSRNPLCKIVNAEERDSKLRRFAHVSVLLRVALISLVTIAAVRTPKVTDPVLLQSLAHPSGVLWDNFIELAEYRSARGDYEASAAAAKRAIALQPQHYSGHWYLGHALWHEQRWDEAAAEFEKVLALNPNHPRAALMREYCKQHVPAP